MTEAFTHDQPPARIVFGPGTLDRLDDELERLAVRRAVVVHGRSTAAAAARLTGERWAGAISEVRRHVPVELAERARERAAELGADGLVALGGGSAIGLAKAVALTAKVPIVAVPTTYSGSEMTPVYGLSEGGRKRTGRDEAVRPRTVIYDPELSRDLPLAVSGPSAMNALAHCVDALWAKGATPVTTLLAEGGARAVREGLDGIVAAADDLDARGQLLYGASLAGWAFGIVGTALHHTTCHVLGGMFDLPHAETHSAVLPQVAARNAPAVPGPAARLAAALGADDLATGAFDLAERAGSPTSLRALGLREQDLDEAAAAVAEAAGELREAARALLQRAWEGNRPGGES
jgi:maleylacetate reductase